MEFKFCAGQNQRTPSPTSGPFSTVPYVSKHSPLQGCEFVPNGFPGNVPALRAFPTLGPVNADEAFQQELEKEQIKREKEKEEIKRETIVGEMELAQRREIEEEVKREMVERALGIPSGISFRERVSVSFMNPKINNQINNINVFCAPQSSQLPPQVDIKQPSTLTNNDNKVFILTKPNDYHYGPKRNTMTPPTVDDNENSISGLQKEPKQEWICMLCQITATSEKVLNAHLQGKKHKAKEASLRTQQIGLDSRPDSQTPQSGMSPADTSILEPSKEDQAVLENKGLAF